MNKILSIFLIFVFIANPSLYASNQFNKKFRRQSTVGQPVDKIISALQVRCDYGSRTDGQPEYCGYAARGSLTSEDEWLLHKFTYDGNDQLTVKQVAYDSYDNRATATYA